MSVGDEIKTRREERELTQAELARLSGVRQSRIAEYETGVRGPTLDALRLLAEVLGPFEVVGGVRDVEHYREAFSTAATIGAELVGRAVYAWKYGHADSPDHTELARITRDVLADHGEVIDREVALRLLAE